MSAVAADTDRSMASVDETSVETQARFGLVAGACAP